MPVELRMPSLGMTMEEGKIVAWRVREGDRVARGQIVVEVESEKAAYEVEAPIDGTIGAILVGVDAVVPVGTPLVAILAADERPAAAAPGTGRPTLAGAARGPAAGTVAAGHGEASRPADGHGEASHPTEGHGEASHPTARRGETSPPATGRGRPRLSPRARALAASLGVDPDRLVGSGPDGTIVEKDVREAAARGAGPGPGEASSGTGSSGEASFTVQALSSMRRAIAGRMAQSAREAPHFFLAAEVDGSALLAWRAAHAGPLEAASGVTLTVTDLLVAAAARALHGHPSLNAAWSAEGIRRWEAVNLGLAVAVEDGLIVPVLRDADRRPMVELMRERHDLVARARARKLRPGDAEGGTFTLSNLGPLGIDFFTSILNPPEAGILSVGALRPRPVVVEDRVVARPTAFVGLTIDHRVTDGAAGARFLQDFKARLETGRFED